MDSVSRCIASFIDGRVRLRHHALKDPELAAVVQETAGSLEGVTSVTVNPVTGSLLLFYDPDRLSREQLLGMAGEWAALLPQEPERRRGACCGCASALLGRKATRLVDRVLLVTLLASLAGASSGMGGLHRTAGAVFALASLQHALAHRRALW